VTAEFGFTTTETVARKKTGWYILLLPYLRGEGGEALVLEAVQESEAVLLPHRRLASRVVSVCGGMTWGWGMDGFVESWGAETVELWRSAL